MAVATQAPLRLTGEGLTVDDVVAVARLRSAVQVPEPTLRRVRDVRDVVDAVLARGTPTYGLNTGLGAMSRLRLPEDELERFAMATVADRTAAHGLPLPTAVVRAMMVTRLNTMAKAGVGVRRELVEAMAELLNRGVHPEVREFGSVGEGDLYEMADIGKVLIGRGRAEVDGRVVEGAQALRAAGLAPLRLAPKEALALISANGVTMGLGSLVLHDARRLLDSMHVAAALSLEGFGANRSILHPAVARARPHPGQIVASRELRRLLADGAHGWEGEAARNLQDPLSFRCLPQTHGAVHDVLAGARASMEVELNSASDNPLVVLEEQAIVSNGNFDVTVLALAFDHLRLALATNMRMAAERVQKHLWSVFSELTTYLGDGRSPYGGLRGAGRHCAALAAEARALANPVSVDYSAQLAEGVEDHGNTAPLSVRRTHELIALSHRVVAEELIVAAEAVGRRGSAPVGHGTRAAFALVREYVPPVGDVTEWDPDVGGLVALIASGELGAEVRAAAGLAPWGS